MVKLRLSFLVIDIVVLKEIVLNTQYILLLLPTSTAQVRLRSNNRMSVHTPVLIYGNMHSSINSPCLFVSFNFLLCNSPVRCHAIVSSSKLILSDSVLIRNITKKVPQFNSCCKHHTARTLRGPDLHQAELYS